jgi:RimJ/RimL family protein N-acetyltransferase
MTAACGSVCVMDFHIRTGSTTRIATVAVRLVTGHAFEVNPELRRLYAMPYARNAASARVLEKAGCRREATLRQAVIKDGEVLDQWIYAMLRDELPERS